MTVDGLSRRLDLLLGAMVEITGHVVGEGTPDAIVHRALDCAIDVFPVRGAFVVSALNGREIVKYTARRGALRDKSALVEKRILPALAGLSARAFDRREEVAVAGLGDASAAEIGISEECDLLPGVRDGVLLLEPMRAAREAVGVLGLLGRGDELLTREHRRMAAVLSDHVAVALLAAEKHRAVETLGLTDALTGTYNYRYLLEALGREIERARRFEEKLSVLMLDMDNLKAYNDSHGHLRGSQVLRRVAQVARGELRAMDIIAKYGGDEFVIVLPQNGREGANLVAERVRRAIENHPFPGEEVSGRITSSLGIAVYPEDGQTVEDLIDRADQALYRAKGMGRNRVSAGVEDEAAWAAKVSLDADRPSDGTVPGEP
jgi:diguanylate cyclase (GGDEF)-like protein